MTLVQIVDLLFERGTKKRDKEEDKKVPNLEFVGEHVEDHVPAFSGSAFAFCFWF